MRERAKEFLVALSLANLCFIRVWPDVLNGLWAETYFLKTRPYLTDAATIVLCVLLLAAVFWLGVFAARRFTRVLPLAAARWIFLGTLLVPLNGIRLQLASAHTPFFAYLTTPAARLPFLSAMAIAGVFLLWRAQRAVVAAANVVLLILSPFVLYTFGQALWPPIRQVDANVLDETPAPRLAHNDPSAGRVVILLFDELDEDAIFSARPESVSLPEVDRLAGQSVHVTNVIPAADSTLKAMPTLMTGKQVTAAQPASANELLITYAGAGEAVPWSREPNIFSLARERGINTALLGWYHPYCRMFGHLLNYCSWEPIETRYGTDPNGGWEPELGWLEVLIDTIPFASRLDLRHRLEKAFHFPGATKYDIPALFIPRYLRMLPQAQILVTDPSLGLILIHWPVPHPPAIYDREADDFRHSGAGSYLDNLRLVNRTLAVLRDSMEKAGLWDETTILITSDHPYREVWKPDWTAEEKQDMAALDGKLGHHVPFLLKLPHQSGALTFDRPMNNLVIPELITGLLNSHELARPESVIEWLSEHEQQAGGHS
jgi:hypothetical protein